MGSPREREIMRGCFLLLFLTSPIFGTAIEREHLALQAAPDIFGPGCLECQDPVSVPVNLTELSGVTGIVNLPDSSNNIGGSLPAPCRAFHCKRPSRKNRKKMICCLLTKGRGGRYKCPNSCD